MPPAGVPDASRRLRALARAASRASEPEFLAKEDHHLYGGFAWEWLRNRPATPLETGSGTAAVPAARRNLHAFCGALEPSWGSGTPLPERADVLLWASAVLRSALPEDFWLPIEADAPLVVLSPTYREMRIRAYNRHVGIRPTGAEGPGKPRWQPYLNSVTIAEEQRARGAAGVMAASWAIHELSHVILMTAPPVDEAVPVPREYVRWLLGQEGKTIAVESRISEEVRSRMPHPFFIGLFNTASFHDGYDRVPSVRKPSRALLGAWLDLVRYASPPRVPPRRVLKVLQTNEDFAVGSLIYALTNRALFTFGARAALVRRLLPRARAGRDGAGALEKEVTAVVAGRSRLDARARARGRSANETAVRAFRAAELHDFLSVLPGGPAADVQALRALGERLRRGRRSRDTLSRTDATLRSVVGRQLPILVPFGFGARYADTHPSLFEINA